MVTTNFHGVRAGGQRRGRLRWAGIGHAQLARLGRCPARGRGGVLRRSCQARSRSRTRGASCAISLRASTASDRANVVSVIAPSCCQNPPTATSFAGCDFAPGSAARSRWASLPWQSMRPGLAATRPSSLQSRYVSCALTSHAKTERPTPAKCGPFVLTSIRTIPFVLADMAYHRMSKTRSNRFAGELGVSDKTRTRRSVDRRLMASFQLFGCHILDR